MDPVVFSYVFTKSFKSIEFFIFNKFSLNEVMKSFGILAYSEVNSSETLITSFFLISNS